MTDLKSIYYLSKVEGLGSVRLKKLLDIFKEPEEIFEATTRELSKADGINEKIIRSIHSVKKNNKKFEAEFNFLEKKMDKRNIGTLIYTDPDYPSILKKIYDPPVILYYKGVMSGEILNNLTNNISIVGTRNPTEYGKKAADMFATELSVRGFNIISGFARGIDTIAHKAVLNSKKKNSYTVAVLGCGVDYIYPPENKKLYQIMENEGMILSECEPGCIPDAMNFPRRNRIISGLSIGVVVVESGSEGGALITARCALDQSREVFAVPGDIKSKYSKGTNNLIKNGQAKLISDVDDILIEFKGKIRNLSLFDGDEYAKHEKLNVDLKGNEKLLYDYLNSCNEAVHIDTISESTSLQISDCLVILLNLEFKGLIRQLAGKMFSVIN